MTYPWSRFYLHCSVFNINLLWIRKPEFVIRSEHLRRGMCWHILDDGLFHISFDICSIMWTTLPSHSCTFFNSCVSTGCLYFFFPLVIILECLWLSDIFTKDFNIVTRRQAPFSRAAWKLDRIVLYEYLRYFLCPLAVLCCCFLILYIYFCWDLTNLWKCNSI